MIRLTNELRKCLHRTAYSGFAYPDFETQRAMESAHNGLTRVCALISLSHFDGNTVIYNKSVSVVGGRLRRDGVLCPTSMRIGERNANESAGPDISDTV